MLILRLAIGTIIIQTLWFKFTAHPSSVYIFNQTGLGDVGRIGTGVIELIAVILLFVAEYRLISHLLIFGLMSGAIFSHLTSIGIEIDNDNGLLFYMACIVFLTNLFLMFKEFKNKYQNNK